MKIIHVISFLLFSGILASLPAYPAGINDIVLQLQDKLEVQPDDPATTLMLARAYTQQYLMDKDDETALKQAKQSYQRFSELEPQHKQVALEVYRLILMQFVHAPERVDFQEARHIYEQSDLLQQSPFSPPEAFPAIQELNKDKPDYQRVIKLLKPVIKAKKHYLSGYIMLAESYLKQKQVILALETAKQGLKQSPNHPGLNEMIADIHYQRIYSESNCIAHNKAIDQAIKFYKQSLKAAPDAINLHTEIASLYIKKNKLDLALHSASMTEKLATKLPDSELKKVLQMDAKREKIYIKLILGEAPELLTGELESLLEGNSDFSELELLFNAYYDSQQWQKAVDVAKRARNADDNFYYSLKHAMALSYLDGQEAATTFLRKVIKNKTLSDWEALLAGHFVGSVSDQKLLEAAANDCEATEANFYIGVKEWQSGHIQTAKDHFEKVLTFNLASYTEFKSARHALRVLNSPVLSATEEQ